MIRLLISSVRAALRSRPQRGRLYPRVAPANPLPKNAATFGRSPLDSHLYGLAMIGLYFSAFWLLKVNSLAQQTYRLITQPPLF